MRVWVIIIVVVACLVPTALAQTPPDTTIWLLTDRGTLFEMEPADLVPTTDVVSSPYIEFQRIGGLVAGGGRITEAAQYNQVGTGPTYIIDNWGRGTTYGIPNGAPLAGKMHLSPQPYLHLRTPDPISPGIYWPAGIGTVEVIEGGLTHAVHNHTTHGEYHQFVGSGRALIQLNPANDHYAINMVCFDCRKDTPAVVGAIPDDGHGNPASTSMGTTVLAAGLTAGPCTVNGINHAGCGQYEPPATNRTWPLDPRTEEAQDGTGSAPLPLPSNPILEITRYDTVTCPGANSANTVIEALNDTHFRMVSLGCIMQNYDYQWWDGDITLTAALPLRAGLNIWENTGDHPAIVLNMRGGEILLQAYVTPTEHNAKTAFDDILVVNPGTLMDHHSLAILHDAFTHLGAYTHSTIQDMAPLVQTHPQRLQEALPVLVAHGRTPNAGEHGGILGEKCTDRRGFKYEYCITIFDNRDLPVINNAQGVVYDPRNAAELNRGTDVDNHGNVFGTGGLFKVPYDTARLNLIQAYGVIPITGSINVEEIYLMASSYSNGCERFIDITTTPHSWVGPPAAGWLGMTYLQGDYGNERSLINIPLLPWYGVVCLRTHGSDEFRQFVLDDFFVQGASASFGGTRYVYTGTGTLAYDPDVSNISVLRTDIILPGSGTRVMDLDIDLAGRVTLAGVVADRGGVYTGSQDSSCDWDRIPVTTPPRHGPSHEVEMDIDVVIEVPGVGGTYQMVGGLSVSDNTQLEAERVPTTIGEDCRHNSYAEFEFDPQFRTIPISYSSNMPVRITIMTDVDFSGSSAPVYAGRYPTETINVETIIDRLSVRVH